MSGLLFLSALASKYPEYSLSNPVCGCEMWFSSITSLFIIQIKKNTDSELVCFVLQENMEKWWSE